MPNVRAALIGDTSSASYRLSDMAADTIGLLDVLGIDSAHLVGASMGGMIAQTAAIEYPERVRSLTSIMSTTGDPLVGRATQRAIAALLSPPASTREEAIDRTVSIVRVIGSPGFELDEADLRWRTGLAYDRSNDPVGVGRQLVAIAASGDRTAAFARFRSARSCCTGQTILWSMRAAAAPRPRPSPEPSSSCSTGWVITYHASSGANRAARRRARRARRSRGPRQTAVRNRSRVVDRSDASDRGDEPAVRTDGRAHEERGVV